MRSPTTIKQDHHMKEIFWCHLRGQMYTNSFFPHTASVWNKLQETIKETQSLDIFKSRI